MFMRPALHPTVLLAALLMLGACKTAPVTASRPTATAPKKASASVAPVVLRERTSLTVPPGETPAPSAAPSLAPTAAPVLATPAPVPAGKTVSLGGLVSIDASYLLSNNGSGLTSKAKLLSDNGGSVLIVGNSLVSNNAGGLISDSGGGLISDSGGGLTAKTKYTLLDAGAEASVPLGEILPVGGMEVTVISLATGKPIDLLDTNGKPFYPIYSDIHGKYVAPVPESQKDNVLIVARVPESQDPRLKYAQVVSATASRDIPIDADHANTSSQIRRTFTSQLNEMMTTLDPVRFATELVPSTNFPPQFQLPITEMVLKLGEAARQAGIDKAPPEVARAIAAQIADAVLAHVDLEAITLDPSLVTMWPGPVEPAVAATTDITRQAREAARRKMRDNADFFKTQPYVIIANSLRPPDRPAQILRPEDLSGFIVEEYFEILGRDPDGNVSKIYESIGATTDATTGFNMAMRLNACRTAISTRVGMTLALNQAGAMDEALGLIAAYAKKPAP